MPCLSTLGLVALSLVAQNVAAQEPLVSKAGQIAAIPNWDLSSSSDISEDLTSLSQTGFDTSSWHHVPVSKCTVMGCLLEIGVYDDEELFFSDNLRRINWGQFTVPWIYRNEFALEPKKGKHFILQTNGITSRADIYLNGEMVADKDAQVGAFAGHNYDITDVVAEGNALVIQAHPTNYYYDLALGFIDWNPWPADNGTGIWRDVTVKETGAISLNVLRSLVDIDPATVTLQVEAKNLEDQEVQVHAQAVITDPEGKVEVTIDETVTLSPRQTKLLEFKHTFEDPKLWWPKQWGEQPLYSAKIDVAQGNGTEISDTVKGTFGLRAVASELNDNEDVVFSINGNAFQVIGAGYAPDMFLRWDPERFESIVKYMLDIGMNTIRLEGHFEHAELYEITDRLGLMVQAGWQCCNKWEAWDYNDHFEPLDIWNEEDYAAANASMIHEAGFLQSHPSLLTFLIGSDFRPNAKATDIYVDALLSQGWQLPIVAAASKRPSADALGPSGMKMAGPYDWIPPNYWYDLDAPAAEDRYGAAFGFGSELGAGVGTPEIGSLRRFLSEQDLEDLWTAPEKGLFHMSTNVSQFYTRSIYNEGLYARYGEPTSLEDYLRKAQVTDYEAIRSEFEAFASRWGAEELPATGMIYWMLNNAWPSLHWNQFDSYLHPAGTYFGSKVGSRIEHVVYNYHERDVWLINRSLDLAGARTVDVDVIDLVGSIVSSTKLEVETEPNASKRIGEVEGIGGGAEGVVFLRLVLKDEEGQVLSRNVYWIAPTNDVLDWEASTWYHTPVTDFADYTSLFSMDPARVKAAASASAANEGPHVVTLENESDVPAFFIRLNLVDEQGEDVNPVTWSDNYVTLWPGEVLELEVYGWDGTGKTVLGDGVNVDAFALTL